MKFKVGDKCRVLNLSECGNYLGKATTCGATHIQIKEVYSSFYVYDILDQFGKKLSQCSDCLDDDDLELIPPPPTSFTVNFDI